MKNLWKEFKAFISRGNVLDMAVGVVIGGAFSAIVTALVNILLSIATWGVPGGLKGLVTVLPAANPTQVGPVGQEFLASDLVQKTVDFANSNGAGITGASDATYVQWQTTLLSKYTLHGGKFTYNLAAVIDWGSFINAIISFLIVAVTLFIIIKVVSTLSKKRAQLKEKADAAAYAAWAKAHPEEAKAKEEAEAAAKAAAEAAANAPQVAPATTDDVVKILAEIRDSLNKDVKAE